jgi:hypothetical protein
MKTFMRRCLVFSSFSVMHKVKEQERAAYGKGFLKGNLLIQIKKERHKIQKNGTEASK